MGVLYEKATPGAKAIVTATKRDSDGFDMLKVRWDSQFGESDRWLYQNHFNVVQDTTLYDARESPEEFAQKIIGLARLNNVDEQKVDVYLEQLNEAVNILAESQGFIILTTREEDDELEPYIYGSFLSPRAMILLESQLVGMAASAHQEMARRMQAKLRGIEDEDT